MLDALRHVGRAFSIWWTHIGEFTLLNLAWAVLQVPILTGPPATAAMYMMARRAADGELLDWRDAARAVRELWWPAWRWGLVNLVVFVVLVGNFYAYQNFAGWVWVALRLAWGGIGVLWLAVNLFYWPLWLAQVDRRLTTTWRNGLLMVAKAPVTTLTLLVVCAALAVVSALVTLPLAVALMAWVSLIGTLAVEAALKAPVRREPEPAVEIEPS
jgi:uncharacterized membrane protein YesL